MPKSSTVIGEKKLMITTDIRLKKIIRGMEHKIVRMIFFGSFNTTHPSANKKLFFSSLNSGKTLEELPEVHSYVKNHFLDFEIPYVKDGKDRVYLPDFIVQVKARNGQLKNLIIEISGMSKDKAEKKWFVENRWLPAVNSLKEKYDYPEWYFIEIADDIRNIKNQLTDMMNSM